MSERSARPNQQAINPSGADASSQSLFSLQRVRDDHRSPDRRESRFSYLDRSARPEAARVRAFVEQCLLRYPVEGRPDLIARLRSIDTTHDAAVFELFVHEILSRSGHRIISVEPEIKGVSTRPDFLCKTPAGVAFYVECAMAMGESDRQRSANNRRDTLLDAIRRVDSSRHLLKLEVRSAPAQSIASARVTGPLKRWIATLPDGDEAKGAEPFRFEEGRFRVVVEVFEARGAPALPGEPAFFSTGFGLRAVQPGVDLRSRIESKANKYGRLDHPYLIAVNAGGLASGEEDLLDALLGTRQLSIRHFDDGSSQEIDGRAADGIWFDARGPRRRHVSGILSFDRVDAWTPTGRGARLVQHPFAERPLPALDLPVERFEPSEGEFLRTIPDSARDPFGLGAGWPRR